MPPAQRHPRRRRGAGALAWVRLVAGGLLTLLILYAGIRGLVLPPAGMSGVERLALVLATAGFALGAAGWAVHGLRPGLARTLRGGFLGVFGLAVVAVFLTPLPVWPAVAVLVVLGLAVVVVVRQVLGASRAPGTPTPELEPRPDGRLVVPVARARAFALAVLAAVMTAASLLPLVGGAGAFAQLGSGRPWYATVLLALLGVLGVLLGMTGVLFFGVALLWLLTRALTPGPALVVDHDGLEDRSSMAAFGRVAWSDVRRVRAVSVAGQPMVEVQVHDPAGVAARLSGWKRAVIRCNARLLRRDGLVVATSLLPGTTAELVERIEQVRPDRAQTAG